MAQDPRENPTNPSGMSTEEEDEFNVYQPTVSRDPAKSVWQWATSGIQELTSAKQAAILVPN